MDSARLTGEIASVKRALRELVAERRRRERARKTKRKRVRRDLVAVLEVEEVRAALRAAEADGSLAHALVAFGYHFGLRAGEYGLVRREHVRLDAVDGGEVYVTAEKDSVSKTQPIRPDVVDLAPALRRWLGAAPASPWLFPSARDPQRPMGREAVARIVARVWQAANLPRRAAYPHILKASVASHLLDAGASAEVVQDWLRHKDARSTQKYLKLTATARRRGDAAWARLGAALRGHDEKAPAQAGASASEAAPGDPNPSETRRVNKGDDVTARSLSAVTGAHR